MNIKKIVATALSIAIIGTSLPSNVLASNVYSGNNTVNEESLKKNIQYATSPEAAKDDEYVKFEDSNLKKIVLLNLKEKDIDINKEFKDELTVGEAKKINYLRIDEDIKSYEGLEYCINLTIFENYQLSSEIHNLAVLGKLKKISSITIAPSENEKLNVRLPNNHIKGYVNLIMDVYPNFDNEEELDNLYRKLEKSKLEDIVNLPTDSNIIPYLRLLTGRINDISVYKDKTAQYFGIEGGTINNILPLEENKKLVSSALLNQLVHVKPTRSKFKLPIKVSDYNKLSLGNMNKKTDINGNLQLEYTEKPYLCTNFSYNNFTNDLDMSFDEYKSVWISGQGNEEDFGKYYRDNRSKKITYYDGKLIIDTSDIKWDADLFNPVINQLKVKKGSELTENDYKKAVTNLLEDIVEFAIIEGVDTSTTGEKTARVNIVFIDNSTKEVEIPVKVYNTFDMGTINPIPNVNENDIEKEEVSFGGTIDLTDNIKNLPEGAEVKDINSKDINTKSPGEYTGKVEVKFIDGSSIIVDIPVIVEEEKIKDIKTDNTELNTSVKYNIDGDTPTYKENSKKEDPIKDKIDIKTPANLGIRELFSEIKSNNNVDKYDVKYVFTIGSMVYEKYINNNQENRQMDVEPYLKNERTMLPLRYVAEVVGTSVEWDNNTRTAIFEKDGLVAKIQIDGDKIEMSNGKVYQLDAKPDNINSRIFAPLTDVSKVFNLTNGNTEDGIDQNIEWDNNTQTVTIRR